MEENKDVNKIIGRNLSVLRKSKKMTQMEMAEKFNYSDKSISKWESGESLPSVEILYNIAKFYNVTLDDLVNENLSLTDTHEQTSKPKRIFPARLIITLLAVSAVWLLATVLFVCFKITMDINIPIIFLWAVPASCIVLIIFNSIWGRQYLLPIILSVLVWSTLVCFHIQLIQYQVWIIYILGVPLQVAIILWGALINKPRPKKEKVKKEKSKKDKKKNTDTVDNELNSDNLTQAENTENKENSSTNFD